ncbi:MAG: serine/threonine-protein kinase [Polyangiaceae bacterium]
MADVPGLIDRSRQALEEALERVRARPLTSVSRAQQIQALALLRTLDDWRTRTPYPDQPARLAKLAHELVSAVLGEAHPRTLALRATSSSENQGVVAATAAAVPTAVRVCLNCRRGEMGPGATCSECRGPLTSFDAPNVIDGRYVLVGEVGRGGMSVVHEAIDVFLERAVALKVVASDEAPTTNSLTSFRREATALAAIRNDHVVQVYTFGVHGNTCYLAMERVVGRDLETIIDEHARHGSALPVPLAVTIIGRVASGLAAAHAAGVLHRDVKPSNIVIEERTGRAVLVDFGLALKKRSVADSLSGVDGAGTPAYLAPELVRGDVQVPREHWNASDIYALGCTAFEILTGRPPFEADTIGGLLEKQRMQPPPRASTRRAGLEAFDNALLRALAKETGERTSSALELARELDDALQVWLTPEPTAPSAARASAAPAPVVVAQSDGYREGARVLIVDDDEVFLKLATRCAELAFYQCPVRIEAAASSQAAIRSAAHQMPDLMILDYSMPGEDGVAALSRLRGMPGGDTPRVVVVSASVSTVEQWRFKALGVTDFVSKPVKFQSLVALIADIAARAGWQHALIAPPGRDRA